MSESQSTGMEKFKVTTAAIVQLVVYVVALTLAYAALDKRITILEAKYDRLAMDISEMKFDVKEVLREMRSRLNPPLQ